MIFNMFTKKDNEQENTEKVFEFETGGRDIHSLYIPDALEETRDMLYLGPGRYARIYAVSVYPRDVYVGWLDDLFSAGEIDLSVMVESIPQRCNKEIERAGSKDKCCVCGSGKKRKHSSASTTEEMLEDLRQNGLQYKQTGTNVLRNGFIAVYGKTPEELKPVHRI